MPSFGPVSRRDLIRYLKLAGFSGPRAGGKHSIMKRGDITIRIPNPHRGDIGRDLLNRLLRQAGISKAEWEQL